jgi:secondary thiamine-phosphate synthase enzyme
MMIRVSGDKIMDIYKKTISIKTSHKDELMDITSDVLKEVRESGARAGVCFIYCPHTTAGLTINENADPAVKKDILRGLEGMIPSIHFSHLEGNSPAHIKASMMGFSLQILIEDGSLVLGTWQGIYFCEFDGPRRRNFHVQIIS